MVVTGVMQKFILFWGEMGTRWGVNRTVAQIQALLYLSEDPLCADQIQEALGVSRSNISNSIRELQGWQLVRLVHVMGDRRDHFTTHEDPWELMIAVVEERKKREIDPALAHLRECSDLLETDKTTPDATRERIIAMRDFLIDAEGWYEELRQVPRPTLRRLMSLGSRIVGLIGR